MAAGEWRRRSRGACAAPPRGKLSQVGWPVVCNEVCNETARILRYRTAWMRQRRHPRSSELDE
jgi:hypothetical protein